MLKDNVRPFIWNSKSKKLFILDQLLLPGKEKWISCGNHLQVADCIRNMNVRGAPAIGCVAAYGMALSALEKKFKDSRSLTEHIHSAGQTLAQTRPTAVNLFWAVERMKRALDRNNGFPQLAEIPKILEKEADKIYEEDLAANHRMGKLGAALLQKKSVVLTHCNAGSLATSGWGTALGVIRSSYLEGKIVKVLVDETRPYLQGARLTAWELSRDEIPYELITDNMAAHLMKTEKIDAVIVGSDRISANGDVANKIGTYALSVLCRYHDIPFYVAAPTSTIDLKISSGEDIPIEERSVREVTHIRNFSIAPHGTVARHPAFDVTPHQLVSALITERGIAKPPSGKTISRLFRP